MGLDAVELVLWAEKRFGIDIPDADAETLVTVGALAAFIHHQLVGDSSTAQLTQMDVFEEIKEYLIADLRIKPLLITPDARFGKDLGLQ